MNVQQLEYFISIANTLSYSKSAELLGLSQPALSMSITKLEEELGFPLFAKSGRNIRLTDSGKQYYQTARRVIDTLSEGALEAKNLLTAKAGYISVAIPNDLPPIYVAQVLNDFMRSFPEVKLNLYQKDCSDIVSSLKVNTIDWAIVPLHKWFFEKSNISYEVLTQQQVYVIVAEENPLANKEILFIEDLVDQNIVVNNDFWQGKLTQVFNSYNMDTTNTDLMVLPPLIEILRTAVCEKGFIYVASFVSERIAAIPHIRIIPLENPSVISEMYSLVWYGPRKELGLHRSFYDFIKARFVG